MRATGVQEQIWGEKRSGWLYNRASVQYLAE